MTAGVKARFRGRANLRRQALNCVAAAAEGFAGWLFGSGKNGSAKPCGKPGRQLVFRLQAFPIAPPVFSGKIKTQFKPQP
jgi:hypothetical protein